MCFVRILRAQIFSTFLCSLALLLSAFMVFILVEVGKHTDFSRDFQQIVAFWVEDFGVLISAIKVLPLLSQFRSPLNLKLFCSASQLCCLSACQVSSKGAVTSGYQLSRCITVLFLPCFLVENGFQCSWHVITSRENYCSFRKVYILKEQCIVCVFNIQELQWHLVLMFTKWWNYVLSYSCHKLCTLYLGLI